MVVHMNNLGETFCGCKDIDEGGLYVEFSTNWDDVDCPECLEFKDKKVEEKPSEDDGACRNKRSLSDIVYMYNAIGEHDGFRYALERIDLNREEMLILVEFLHCRCL